MNSQKLSEGPKLLEYEQSQTLVEERHFGLGMP
jgi:hypothetical protein